MRRPRPAVVAQVLPGSKAESAGIGPGDRIVRVNGRAPRDYIDYRYLAAEPQVSLTVQAARGGLRRITIAKPIDEDLGIRFAEDVFDGVRRCRNECPFCFVDQLPRGLRQALYVRDDDYRLSFLHGNFITLTNLTAADEERIARLHLSPLYVSVHATEPEVRQRMFGRPTPDVLAAMARLAARGIEFHTQIVVCPRVNDGAHLDRTIADLAALHPAVRSIGVVPVGLTRHRHGRPRVVPVGPEMARELIDAVRRWQRACLRRLGTRLVFAADELYLLAREPVPGRAAYEGFPQLANGIGCARLFIDGVNRLRLLRLRRAARVTLVTGEMAAGLVGRLANRLAAAGSVQAEVCVVPNRLFGRSVTTAGLLAGKDIARALRRCDVGEVLIVPATAIREGEGFLDGMTPEDLSRLAGAEVIAAATPAEAAAALRRRDRMRART